MLVVGYIEKCTKVMCGSIADISPLGMGEEI